MSLLNQLFNRGVLGAKGKTCLNLVLSRIKLIQNKRLGMLNEMQREIAQFLQTGQEAIARIRVEHFIREHNLWAAYEILELFCEFVITRLPIMDSQRECPSELQTAVASIIFAAPRCSDLPDLMQIKNLFTAKYGKDFASTISELRPDSSVNRSMIEKLSASPPSAEAKLKRLKKIAQEHKVDWDSSETEAEFSKKHEDLLDGSERVRCEAAGSHAPTKPFLSESSPIARPKPLTSKTSDSQRSSDALEKARAAVASAERASAAARAAAELVNCNSGPWKLGSHKSLEC